jgi:hypothetical protein
MKPGSTRRSLAWLLVMGGFAAGSHVGCDSGGGGGGGNGGGGNGTSEAACSSCQEAYTEEDCKKWGDLAGCEESVVTDADTCKAGIAGCSFKSCKGPPICNDEGTGSCASCDGDLSQKDCDAMADAAGCSSATTSMFNACGKDAIGCDFVGCDFTPSCD